MAASKLVLHKYMYEIELSYINEKTNKATAFMPEQIKSIVIDRNYDSLNMPIMFANIALEYRQLDELVKNYKKDTMIIKIYKILTGDITLKEKFLECKCTYFINDGVNYLEKLAYNEKDKSDKYTLVTIGLMSLDVINNNKALALGTSISGSTNDIIKMYSKKINLLMEKLDYNETYKNQIVQSVNSISELISYLNSISVLYKTSYRFFMDFDRSYLVSSSNKAVPAAGETMDSVLIIVEDIMKGIREEEGMYINKDKKAYQINVLSTSTDLKKNQVLEKYYTSITGTTTSGDSGKSKLDVNKAQYSSDKENITRISNNNLNMIDNIQGDLNSSAVVFAMSKEGLDSSVLNINKKYTVKNFDAHSDVDGEFLLSRKLDIFARDDHGFSLSTSLIFRIKP